MTKTNGAISPLLTRLACCAFAGIAILLNAPAAPAAEQPDRCAVPLAWPAEALDPATFWDNDRQISILRREDGQRFAYRIVGDVVELNATLFPALATAPDGRLTDISEIAIDAREIILDMPLRLDDGVIRLRADVVRFAGGGSIALVDPPKEREQAVEITARSLDLSHARAVPFVFATQGWQLTEPPHWPVGDGPKRMLRLKLGEIVPAEVESDASKAQLKQDPLRWLHNRTADQGFDSGTPKELWSAGYDITIGDAGAAAYDDLFANSLLWPDMVAGKVLRLRSRGAFDAGVDAFLRAKIAELLPRFDTRSSRQSGGDDAADPAADRRPARSVRRRPLRPAADRPGRAGHRLRRLAGRDPGHREEGRRAGIVGQFAHRQHHRDAAGQYRQADRAARPRAESRRRRAQRRRAAHVAQHRPVADSWCRTSRRRSPRSRPSISDLRAEYESRKTAAESYGGAVGTLSSIPVPVSFGFLAGGPGAPWRERHPRHRARPSTTAPRTAPGRWPSRPAWPTSPPATPAMPDRSASSDTAWTAAEA